MNTSMQFKTYCLSLKYEAEAEYLRDKVERTKRREREKAKRV